MNIFRSVGITLLLFALFLLQAKADGLQNQCNSYLTESNSEILTNSFSNPNTIENSTFQNGLLNLSHNTHYDLEISSMSVLDQCETGHCHLYTWLAKLEHGSGIQLSEDHLDVMNIYHVALKALENGDTKLFFGSNPEDARDAILSYGLMPANVWNPIHKPNSRKVYSKIKTGLETILLKSKLNNLEKDKVKVIIFNFIQSIVGVWPTEFKYLERDHTPKSFLDQYFGNLKNTLVTVVRTNKPQTINFPESTTFPKVEILKHQIEFEDMLMSVLDKGKPAYLSYNHHDQFIDSETGIMSISAFNFPEEAVIVSHEVISENYLWKGPHAVVVIGYQKDPMTGRPIKWKIMNSWGVAAGDHGFFHMYSDYFQLHAWSFSFIDD